MSINIHGFPLNTCNSICSTPDECLSYTPRYVKCITNVVINRMCYISSILSMQLHDDRYEQHKTMLISAVKDLQIIADWVEVLQNNGGDKGNSIYKLDEDRRLCPRFKVNKINAEINGSEYPVFNMSLNGCFINTEVPYPSGTNITMRLAVEGGISIVAMVRHSTGYGIGVEFINIEKAKEKEFYSFLSEFFFQTALNRIKT